MPSNVYLHDGEKQITVQFPTEEDRERFVAHYRAIDARVVESRAECYAALRRVAALVDSLRWIAAHAHGALDDKGGGLSGALRNIVEVADEALAGTRPQEGGDDGDL